MGLILDIEHELDHRKVQREILERRAGIEPANTGFADLRVSHFATGAFLDRPSGAQQAAERVRTKNEFGKGWIGRG